MEGVRLLKEYLDLAEQYPTPMRMIRGHTFSLIGELCKPCMLTSHHLYGQGPVIEVSSRHCNTAKATKSATVLPCGV